MAGRRLGWLVLILLAGGSPCSADPIPRAVLKDSAITIVAGGDILLDRGVRQAIEETGDPAYPFSAIAPLFRAGDIGLANLECALVDSGVPVYKQFMFRGDAAMSPVLRTAGLTALSLANNHAYDYGRDGLVETGRHLTEAGIQTLGAGPDQQTAARPRFVEIRGVRIALLAFVDLVLEGLAPLADRPSPALADSERVCAAVSDARAGAEFVIVSVHWGDEYASLPSARQTRLARLLAAAGVDVVIGHHPHVVEPFEWIDGTLVLYSLGNLVFDRQRPGCEDELLVRILIHRTGRSGPQPDGFPVRDSRDANVADHRAFRALPDGAFACGGRSRAGLAWTAELVPLRLSNCRPAPAIGAQVRSCLARVSGNKGSD